MINSSNHGYHINMFRPTKLLLDGESAVIEVGDNTRIHGSCLHAKSNIHVGKNCLIAANCQIMDCSGHMSNFDNPSERLNTTDIPKSVIIEDNVWIGANSFVLPGVTIKTGSIIGAGSIVTKNIPAYSLAVGNPCKVVRTYNPQAN